MGTTTAVRAEVSKRSCKGLDTSARTGLRVQGPGGRSGRAVRLEPRDAALPAVLGAGLVKARPVVGMKGVLRARVDDELRAPRRGAAVDQRRLHLLDGRHRDARVLPAV